MTYLLTQGCTGSLRSYSVPGGGEDRVGTQGRCPLSGCTGGYRAEVPGDEMGVVHAGASLYYMYMSIENDLALAQGRY